MAETKEKQKKDWVKMKPAEVEKIILDLHKEGNSASKIGLLLRDKYGIPRAKLMGIKIQKTLKKAGKKVVSEKEQKQKKIEKLKAHLEKNKHDQSARRRLSKDLWAARKLQD